MIARERSRSRLRSRAVLAVVIASALSLSFLGALIIPLYSYPGVDWNAIVKSKQANPGVQMVVIINPNNGPGLAPDPNYVAGINTLRSAGVIVLGYDHTSYGSRSISDVIADINHYKSWYNVNGLFFDEMSNVPGLESYYSSLNQYAKSVGLPFTVGNPGASVPPSYFGTVDVIVTYENQGIPAASSLASVTNGLPKNSAAIVAYGVNSFDSIQVGNLFNYANYVYVTNNTLPNPYGKLSGDFANLIALLSAPTQPPPTTPSLTVKSVTTAGVPIVGLWSAVTAPDGSVSASGYTALTHALRSGVNYGVTVSNYGNYVFDHWSDGSTNPLKTITMTQDTTLTASFRTGPVIQKLTLTVRSLTLNGATLNGFWTTIQSGGNTVASGFTPLSYTGTSGTKYTASVSNYGNYVFDHWDDSTTNPARTVTLTQSTTLTAYYRSTVSTTVPITIQSVMWNGAPITGLWTTVQQSDGTQVASGFTPLTFTGTTGATYTVTVSSYGSYIFDHWSDGNVNPVRTLTVTQQTTLVAYYSVYTP